MANQKPAQILAMFRSLTPETYHELNRLLNEGQTVDAVRLIMREQKAGLGIAKAFVTEYIEKHYSQVVRKINK